MQSAINSEVPLPHDSLDLSLHSCCVLMLHGGLTYESQSMGSGELDAAVQSMISTIIIMSLG